MVADEFGGEAGMDLIFGLACDGRAYPDFPGLGAGVVHAAVVGPMSAAFAGRLTL